MLGNHGLKSIYGEVEIFGRWLRWRGWLERNREMSRERMWRGNLIRLRVEGIFIQIF